MSTQTSNTELCTTCFYGKTCKRCLAYDMPIVYCEDYEAIPALNNSISPQQKLKGLCQNCINRYTCILDKSEGGVWHCNEYQ